MIVGDFVKYTNIAEDGEPFVVRGEVTKIDERLGIVHMDAEHPYNICALELEPERYEVIKKPTSFVSANIRYKDKKRAKTINKTGNTDKAFKRPQTSKKPKTGSKREKVIELVKTHPSLSRKEQIAMVVEKIGMTPAGASTYVSEARKHLR